jgi:Zn-dependent peptidase ImmA (M78 family)
MTDPNEVARRVCKKLGVKLLLSFDEALSAGMEQLYSRFHLTLTNGFYLKSLSGEPVLYGVDRCIYLPKPNDFFLYHELGHALDDENLVQAFPDNDHQILEQELVASVFAARQIGRDERLHNAYAGYKKEFYKGKPRLRVVIDRVRLAEKKFKELKENVNDTDRTVGMVCERNET